jgi:hypothetical protein
MAELATPQSLSVSRRAILSEIARRHPNPQFEMNRRFLELTKDLPRRAMP